MKVLFINSVAGYGSTGRIVITLSELVSGSGNEYLIAYGRKSAPKDINSYKILSKFSVIVHAVFTRITDKHALLSKIATRKLINRIEKFNPDIIHLHNLHGYYINIEVLFHYLYESNKKVVWTLHDCWAFTGHCTHYDFIQCNKWKTECNKCPLKKDYPASFVMDNSIKNFRIKKELFTKLSNLYIVAPSKWLHKQVEDSFLNKYRITTIQNGINLDKFYPRESDIKEKYSITDKIIIIGVASVWTKNKGLTTFYDLNERLGSKYQIMLVGLSKKQLNQLPKGIIGFGRLNSVDELCEMYTVADLFVNPTLEDTFPTTNIEALGCGTPVITYNTGGSPEIIDANSGIVVEKNDIQSLIYEITHFDFSRYTTNNCINRSKFFDSNIRYSYYMKLYESVHSNTINDIGDH